MKMLHDQLAQRLEDLLPHTFRQNRPQLLQRDAMLRGRSGWGGTASSLTGYMALLLRGLPGADGTSVPAPAAP